MSTADHIALLRGTARTLRSVSGEIGTSRALTVYRLAGPDTWIGPTPQACHDSLIALRRQLQASQQTLNDNARRLERQADALEHQLPIPIRGSS